MTPARLVLPVPLALPRSRGVLPAAAAPVDAPLTRSHTASAGGGLRAPLEVRVLARPSPFDGHAFARPPVQNYRRTRSDPHAAPVSRAWFQSASCCSRCCVAGGQS